jgi:hypothetical protein
MRLVVCWRLQNCSRKVEVGHGFAGWVGDSKSEWDLSTYCRQGKERWIMFMLYVRYLRSGGKSVVTYLH